MAPLRSIDDYTHETSADNASDWQSDKPSAINPQDHAPVNALVGAGAKSNTNGRTNDALGSRNGKCETSGHNDSGGAAEFHTEPARRGV